MTSFAMLAIAVVSAFHADARLIPSQESSLFMVLDENGTGSTDSNRQAARSQPRSNGSTDHSIESKSRRSVLTQRESVETSWWKDYEAEAVRVMGLVARPHVTHDQVMPTISSSVELSSSEENAHHLPHLEKIQQDEHSEILSLKEALFDSVLLARRARPATRMAQPVNQQCMKEAIQNRENALAGLSSKHRIFSNEVETSPMKFSPTKRSFAIPSVVEIDDENGQNRSLCCYHMLPLYGRSSDSYLAKIGRPSVLVSLSIFAADGSAGITKYAMYWEGTKQIIDSLPHIARRLDIHLAVFLDDFMFHRFAEFQDRDRVALVRTPKSGMSAMLNRFRWHDLALLRSEGLQELGMREIPDIILSWDSDNILDSPALDWYVQLISSRPEYIFGMPSTRELGPNNIPRLIDAESFAIAARRMPSNFTWPDLVHPEQLAFMRHGKTKTLWDGLMTFVKGKNNAYAIDEEALSYMMNEVAARDGPDGFYLMDDDTQDQFVSTVMNTGKCGDDDTIAQVWVASQV